MVLPFEDDHFTPQEEACFAQRQIYWSLDGNCYPLLQQGPCKVNEWLVAQEIPSSIFFPTDNRESRKKVKVSCKRRPCPCSDSNPLFCEVLVKGSLSYQNSNCRNCVTSLAAEQDGLCGKGEQLLNSPFGFGICGCKQGHVNWPLDGKCYPLYQRGGPCGSNDFSLHWDPNLQKPICILSLCPYGLVLSPLDGKCHSLGTQGK